MCSGVMCAHASREVKQTHRQCVAPHHRATGRALSAICVAPAGRPPPSAAISLISAIGAGKSPF